jgi:hypothetical protein
MGSRGGQSHRCLSVGIGFVALLNITECGSRSICTDRRPAFSVNYDIGIPTGANPGEF